MKVLISSKHLASELNKIDFLEDNVNGIKSDNDGIYIMTNNQTFKIHCEILQDEFMRNQDNVNWGWIKLLVNKVDEQPMILDIRNQRVDVIFQY